VSFLSQYATPVLERRSEEAQSIGETEIHV
jgi:hypothetical protein